MTISEIESLAKEYARVREALAERVQELNDAIEAVKRPLMLPIKRAVSLAAGRQEDLRAAIEAAPHLFEKPRTQVFHGIKVGFRDVGAILGLDVQRGDFLDGYQPGDFNVVMTNPPFGKVGDVSDSTAAAICTEETRIGAILPRGFMNSERPKARVDATRKFKVLHSYELPSDTFKPLTSVGTEMVILQSLTPRRAPKLTTQVSATGSLGYEQSFLL